MRTNSTRASRVRRRTAADLTPKRGRPALWKKNIAEFGELRAEASRLRHEAQEVRAHSELLCHQLAVFKDQFVKSQNWKDGLLAGVNGEETRPLARILNQAQHLLPQDDALRLLNSSLFTAMEEERSRIARELHDDLNQSVAFLRIKVAALEHSLLASDERTLSQLRMLAGGLDELSDKITHISRELHPAILRDLGLKTAMRSYVSKFSEYEQTQAAFRARNVPRDVPPQVSICLYRILQEALHNVSKHAKSKRVSVALSLIAGNRLRLTIRDYGIGLEVMPRKTSGLGLVSMAERAKLVQGLFSIWSRPGRGTRVEVNVPVAQEAADMSQANHENAVHELGTILPKFA